MLTKCLTASESVLAGSNMTFELFLMSMCLSILINSSKGFAWLHNWTTRVRPKGVKYLIKFSLQPQNYFFFFSVETI